MRIRKIILTTFAGTVLSALGLSGGPPVACAQEKALSADAFVDSIGIDQFTPDDGAGFFDAANAYGFRHARAALLGFRDPNHAAIANAGWSRYGITLDMIVDQPSTPATNVTWLQNANPGAVDGVEGPNEVDGGYGIGNAAAPGYQQALYNAVKADPRFGGAKVLNFTVINDYQSSSDANDFANVHSYGFEDGNNAFLPPDQSPYGAAGYGSLDFNIGKAERGLTHPPKPVVFTEAGYFTTPGHAGRISRLGQAKYLPMLLADNFRSGVLRTYLYSLFDTSEGTDLNGQPAGTAVGNLIALLSESSWNSETQTRNTPSFVPGALQMNVNASGGNVEHLLLQKSDGVFYLMMWNAVPVYDARRSPPDLTNPGVQTTISFGQPIKGVTLYVQGADGSYSTYALDASGGSLTGPIVDSMMVFEITPG